MRPIIRKLTLAALFAAAVPVAAAAVTLDCAMAPNGSGPYDRALLEELLPLQQSHRLGQGVARAGAFEGVVTQDDNGRLVWRYQVIVARDAGMSATVEYTFLRAKRMLIARVDPGGNLPRLKGNTVSDFQFLIIVDDTGEAEYVPVMRADGTCQERP